MFAGIVLECEFLTRYFHYPSSSGVTQASLYSQRRT
jgi:hypothetical protein